MKIILANASLQNGNRGCGALTYSYVALIDRLFRSAGKSYEIWLSDAQIKDWAFNGVFTMCDREYRVRDISYPPRSFLRRVLNLFRMRRSAFVHADCVLNVGQGDSYSDIYGVSRFKEMDRANVLARRLGIPYCILPQTIGPFSTPTLLPEIRRSLRGAEQVMVRDRLSLEQVRQLVPSCDVREYIDVAFFLPYEKIIQTEDFVHVGLNVSALLWHGGYTRQNQFGLKGDYSALIRGLVRQFLQDPRVKIHLMAHVCESSSNIENDYEIAYELWQEIQDARVVLAPFALDPVMAKSYIAGFDFFVGSRMHATIAAFSSGVPVVPLAYSRKFSGLFEETLNYRQVVDLRTLDNDATMAFVRTAFERRETLAADIAQRNATIVAVRGSELERSLKKFFTL